MKVIHDGMWQRCLADATKMYRISEPDEKCIHLANATWVLKKKYQEAAQKKEDRQIVFIDKLESTQLVSDIKNVSRSKTTHICQAITMSGKRCSFKAVCGDYCKKHNVKSAQLGKRVDVSKIKILD